VICQIVEGTQEGFSVKTATWVEQNIEAFEEVVTACYIIGKVAAGQACILVTLIGSSASPAFSRATALKAVTARGDSMLSIRPVRPERIKAKISNIRMALMSINTASTIYIVVRIVALGITSSEIV
jgi:hypothetical protein